MLFKKDILIPSQTTKQNPVEHTIPITAGIITKIGVFFPWGCANLAGVQIYRYTFLLTPLTRGEWLGGNDFFHIYETNHIIDQEPWELVIKGFNIDDTYSHTPFIHIEMTRNIVSNKLAQLLEVLG